jgi:DNA-binding transcriptional LysR family regulator
MMLDWLHDLIAIVETGTYAAASRVRHVTQPALSRRIQALEEWVGAPLFIRGPYRVALSDAGRSFIQTAHEVVRRLEDGRESASAIAGQQAGQVRVASTNALAFGYFPDWICQLEPLFSPPLQVQFTTSYLEACERMMLKGEVDFLLAHRHVASAGPLDHEGFVRVALDQDTLIPVSTPCADAAGEPLHPLPGTPDAPVSHLSYLPQAGLARVMAAGGPFLQEKAHLQSVFGSHASGILATMTLQGRGVAWLPVGLIRRHLEEGRLVRAGGSEWDIPMQICLYRQKDKLSPMSEALWTTVLKHHGIGERSE